MKVLNYYAEPQTPQDDQLIRDQIGHAVLLQRSLSVNYNEAKDRKDALERLIDPGITDLEQAEKDELARCDVEDINPNTSDVLKEIRSKTKALRAKARASQEYRDRVYLPEFDAQYLKRIVGKVDPRRTLLHKHNADRDQSREWLAQQEAFADCEADTSTKRTAREAFLAAREQAAARPWTRVRTKIPHGEGSFTVGEGQASFSLVVKKGYAAKSKYLDLDPTPVSRCAATKAHPKRVCRDSSGKAGVEPNHKRFYRLTLTSVGVQVSMLVRMHRPLEAGLLKKIAVHRKRDGRRYRYRVQFTLDETRAPAEEQEPVPDPVAHAVAIDLNWRWMPNGILIAKALGTDGVEHELIIPNSAGKPGKDGKRGKHRLRGMAAQEQISGIESVRDKRLNDLKDELSVLRKAVMVPEWFRDETRYCHQWRSVKHVYRLVKVWRDRQFCSGEALFLKITGSGREDFLVKDRHLERYATGLRENIHNAVLTQQRQFATRLAKHYSIIIVEKLSAPEMLNRKSEAARKANQRKQVVAPFRLIATLKEAANKYRRVFVEVDPKYTSRDCSKCTKDMGKSSSKILWCPYCAEFVDRDLNAARNILARGLKSLEVESDQEGSVVEPSERTGHTRHRRG